MLFIWCHQRWKAWQLKSSVMHQEAFSQHWRTSQQVVMLKLAAKEQSHYIVPTRMANSTVWIIWKEATFCDNIFCSLRYSLMTMMMKVRTYEIYHQVDWMKMSFNYYEVFLISIFIPRCTLQRKLGVIDFLDTLPQRGVFICQGQEQNRVSHCRLIYNTCHHSLIKVPWHHPSIPPIHLIDLPPLSTVAAAATMTATHPT